MQNVAANLQIIFNTIGMNLSLSKMKVFLHLKNLADTKRINEHKAKLIFFEMHSSLNTVTNFYLYKERLSKLKCFLQWKKIIHIKYKLSKLKQEVEKSLETMYEKEIGALESKIEDQDKDSIVLKESLEKNTEIKKELLSKIKDYEERESDLHHSFKRMEREKKRLEEELQKCERELQEDKGNTRLKEQVIV